MSERNDAIKRFQELHGPILYLPASYAITVTLQKDESRQPYVRPLSALEKMGLAVIDLMNEGKAEEAGAAARIMATKAYDEELDRHFCEETGNVYFHECDHDSCY